MTFRLRWNYYGGSKTKEANRLNKLKEISALNRLFAEAELGIIISKEAVLAN